MREHYDVVIIGAGLAGLSLTRQLLLTSDKTILLVEKRAEIPHSDRKSERPSHRWGVLLLEGARHGRTPAPRALHEVQLALLLEKR